MTNTAGTDTDRHSEGTAEVPQGSPLALARDLRKEMPDALRKTGGDMEGWEWWEKHADLFEQARQQFGCLHSSVYHYRLHDNVAGWLKPEVAQALADGSPGALQSVLQEACCDSAGHKVYYVHLFTDEFCDLLLDELDHIEASGIPLRRPNGMNRFGSILSQLGFQTGLLEPLMAEVAKPFSRMLWPEWVSERDCDETYGFVVRYRIGEDLDLAEHSDTSNITLNACLGKDFEGGDLYFKGCRFTDSAEDTVEHLVRHRKGVAVLHLGGQSHGVHPITSGERSNLVLWATAPGGVVRIRPDF